MADNQIIGQAVNLKLLKQKCIIYSPKYQYTPMFKLYFVSNNILLYHDTSKEIHQYVYTLYRCLIMYTMINSGLVVKLGV